jgi:hypothetical protein
MEHKLRQNPKVIQVHLPAGAPGWKFMCPSVSIYFLLACRMSQGTHAKLEIVINYLLQVYNFLSTSVAIPAIT